MNNEDIEDERAQYLVDNNNTTSSTIKPTYFSFESAALASLLVLFLAAIPPRPLPRTLDPRPRARLRALKVSYSDLGEGGVAVNCK